MATLTKLFTEDEVLDLVKESTMMALDGASDDERMLITLIGAKVAAGIIEKFKEMKKEN